MRSEFLICCFCYQFDQLAEDSGEISKYLTSSTAKRRRQAFNLHSKRRFCTTLGSISPGPTAHFQGHIAPPPGQHPPHPHPQQQHPHQGGSSGAGSNATTSDESSNCSFDATSASITSSVAIASPTPAQPIHKHHNLLTVCSHSSYSPPTPLAFHPLSSSTPPRYHDHFASNSTESEISRSVDLKMETTAAISNLTSG